MPQQIWLCKAAALMLYGSTLIFSCLIPPLLENSVVFFSNSAVKR
jgi:hypothetical protein